MTLQYTFWIGEIRVLEGGGAVGSLQFLSIEFHSIRLGGPAQGIVKKSEYKRVTFCLSKTGVCAVISSQISFQFTGEIVYYLLCMPPFVFWFQCCQLSRGKVK